MKKLARRCGFVIAAAWTLLLVSQPSKAGITTYTDRAAWLAALGSPLSDSENFETFASDASFQAGPVNLSGFTLGQVGPGDFRNLIEVDPFQFNDNNGTAHASMYVDFGVTQVELTADAPMRAFGADFSGSGGAELVNVSLFTSGATLPLRDVPEVPNTAEFWGYIATGVDVSHRLRFAGRTNLGGGEGFGMDNVGLVVVPEPSTAAVSVAIGVALAVRRRRRGAQRAAP
jgi:hypothetical protein